MRQVRASFVCVSRRLPSDRTVSLGSLASSASGLSCNMMHEFDNITLIERDEGVVLCLPDGLSVEVPQDTLRRSAVLQEAIQTSETGTNVSTPLPRGYMQDWLQSVDALMAAATSTGHGTDIASNPRLLQFIRLRCSIVYGLGLFPVSLQNRSYRRQRSLLVLLQSQSVLTPQDAVFVVPHVSGGQGTMMYLLKHQSADAAAAYCA